MPDTSHAFKSDWPQWFSIGHHTPQAHTDNVVKGRHPLGKPLTVIENAKCGNCKHHVAAGGMNRYHQCGKFDTCIRVSWRGCSEWEAKPRVSLGLI